MYAFFFLDCNPFTYGQDCSFQCSCVQNQTSSCDKRSGNCTCLPGWTSSNCSVDVNECNNVYCGFNGYCVNTPGSYTCMCYSGYELSESGTCVVIGWYIYFLVFFVFLLLSNNLKCKTFFFLTF